MSSVEVLSTAPAIAEIVMAGGVIVAVECVAPAIVEVVTVGTQGVRGLDGSVAPTDPGDVTLYFDNALI